MTITEQQAVVALWARRADDCAALSAGHRAAIREWKQDRFANPAMLAAAFAGGLWWGTGRRGSDSRKARATKRYAGLLNAGLIAWRILAPRVLGPHRR